MLSDNELLSVRVLRDTFTQQSCSKEGLEKIM
jgi:hypothetical protein